MSKRRKKIKPNPLAKRDECGKILPGASLNPAGRPKGSVSGRSQFVRMIDELLSEEDVIVPLRRELRRRLATGNLDYLTRVLLPLIPKETLLKIDQAEKAPLRILLDYEPTKTKGKGKTSEE